MIFRAWMYRVRSFLTRRKSGDFFEKKRVLFRIIPTITPPNISPKNRGGFRYFIPSAARKNGAVRLSLLRATCSGVPQATTLPPSGPASGPMSMT